MIFENDVIIEFEKFINYVEFENGCFFLTSRQAFLDEEFSYINSETVEIIGTIFDKEL